MEKSIIDLKDSPKAVWAIRVATGLGGIAALALLAPLIWGAVSAGVGLLTLALLGIAGIGLFQILPLLGQKWENKILALRKAEARKNPIEQLQNFLLQKRQRVNQFKAAVSQIGSQIKGMQDMIHERKAVKPEYDATRQEKALAEMQGAHRLLIEKYKNAELALTKLEEVIEDKKFEWKFGQAGQKAIQSLNATSGQDMLDQMLADEAFDSVRNNFNQVFAELEVEASRLSSSSQLSFDDGMTIDLSSINLSAKESLQVKR